MQLCVQHADKLRPHCDVPLPPLQSYDTASDKWSLYQWARQHEVNVPRSWLLAKREDVPLEAASTSGFVIKKTKESIKPFLKYAKDIQEINHLVSKYFDQDDEPLILQERIHGQGHGYFALYDEGERRLEFAHKRIREYPPSGGVSTAAESTADPELVEQGRRILDLLQWNGIAMVEYKRSAEDGKYYLIEINPKWWGSIELALSAGIDFVQGWVESPPTEVPSWRPTRFQWLLSGEVFHAMERPSSIPAIFSDLSQSRTDLWWRDLVPHFYQVLYIPYHLYRILRSRVG